MTWAVDLWRLSFDFVLQLFRVNVSEPVSGVFRTAPPLYISNHSQVYAVSYAVSQDGLYTDLLLGICHSWRATTLCARSI